MASGPAVTESAGRRFGRQVRRALLRVRYELGTAVRPYPRLYLPVARLRNRGRPVVADTELVIEGFPRSGNTFASAAFDLAQIRPVRVAHHEHASAQVIEAVRREIPAIVLIRRPEDAVLSLVVQHPELSIGQTLRAFVRFHRSLLPYRGRFMVVSFEDLVGDFGAVIRRANERFGTAFEEFVHNEPNARKVLEVIEEDNRRRWAGAELELKMARPSALRDQAKDDLRARYRSERLTPLRERAERLYAVFRRDA